MPAGINPGDITMMAQTLWAENNNASPQEYAAMAHVMRNRLLSGDPQYGGNSMAQILLAPKQFTPWSNPKAKNFPTKADPRDPAYQSAYRIASGVMTGDIDDPTGGAVNYHAASMKRRPSWVTGRDGQQVGDHVFYKPAQQVASNKPNAKDYADLLEDPAQNQPAQGAAIGQDQTVSKSAKPDPENYADLLEDSGQEPKPAEPEKRPQNFTEDVSAAKKALAGGQSLPLAIRQSVQDLVARHPTVAAGVLGTGAAVAGLPIAGAAAAPVALPLARILGNRAVQTGLAAAVGSSSLTSVPDAFHYLLRLTGLEHQEQP